jgi:hypothetical protein
MARNKARKRHGFHFSDRRYILLTYPRVPKDFNPLLIRDHIVKLGGKCRIGQEYHKDGGIHYHCFIDFPNRFSTKDCRVFDVDNRHPNIRTIGVTPHRAWDYASKGGIIVVDECPRPAGTDNKNEKDSTTNSSNTILGTINNPKCARREENSKQSEQKDKETAHPTSSPKIALKSTPSLASARTNSVALRPVEKDKRVGPPPDQNHSKKTDKNRRT